MSILETIEILMNVNAGNLPRSFRESGQVVDNFGRRVDAAMARAQAASERAAAAVEKSQAKLVAARKAGADAEARAFDSLTKTQRAGVDAVRKAEDGLADAKRIQNDKVVAAKKRLADAERVASQNSSALADAGARRAKAATDAIAAADKARTEAAATLSAQRMEMAQAEERLREELNGRQAAFDAAAAAEAKRVADAVAKGETPADPAGRVRYSTRTTGGGSISTSEAITEEEKALEARDIAERKLGDLVEKNRTTEAALNAKVVESEAAVKAAHDAAGDSAQIEAAKVSQLAAANERLIRSRQDGVLTAEANQTRVVAKAENGVTAAERARVDNEAEKLRRASEVKIAAENNERVALQALERDREAARIAEQKYVETANSSARAHFAAKAGLFLVATGLVYGANAAQKFEEKMRNVSSLSQEAGTDAAASEAQFRRQGDAVLAMSTRIPKAADDLADGLYEIASSGFFGAQGLQVLNASARAAVAGVTTVDIAAKAIVGTLNSYGKSAADAGHISDVLFQTVKFGVIRFDELGTALSYVTNLAAASDVSIEEVGAAIGTMTRAGIQGAKSGVLLQNVFQSFLRPTEELNALFKEQTDQTATLYLSQNGLYKSMQLVERATGGFAGNLGVLFHNSRSLRGVTALLAGDMKIYGEAMDATANAAKVAGATQRTFDEQMKSSVNRMRVALNQMKADAIKTGQAVLPFLTSLGSGLAALASTVAGHGKAVAIVAAAYAAWLAGPAISRWGDRLFGMFARLSTAADAYIAQISEVSLVQGRAAAAGTALSGAVSGLGRALSAFGPTVAILGITAVTAAWAGARAEAKAYRDAITANFDTSLPRGLMDSANAQEEAFKQAKAKYDEMWKASNKNFGFNFDNVLLPTNWRKFFKASDEVALFGKASDQQWLQGRNIISNIDSVNAQMKNPLPLIASNRELTVLGESVSKKANEMGIDLSDAFDKSQPARDALLEALQGPGGLSDALQRAGVNAKDAGALTDEVLTEMGDQVDEFAKKAKDSFQSAFSITADFSPPDLTSSQEAVNSIREQMATLRANHKEEKKAETDQNDRQLEKLIADRDKYLAIANGTTTATIEVASRVSEFKPGSSESYAYKQEAAQAKAAAAAEKKAKEAQAKADAKQKEIDLRTNGPVQGRGAINADNSYDAQIKKLQTQLDDALKELDKAVHPEKYVKSQIEKKAKDATEFTKLFQKAVEEGLDPTIMGELIAEGPDKALMFLRAVLDGGRKDLIGYVNGAQADLNRLSTAYVLSTKIFNKATDANTRADVTAEAPTAQRIASLQGGERMLRVEEIVQKLNANVPKGGKALTADEVLKVIRDYALPVGVPIIPINNIPASAGFKGGYPGAGANMALPNPKGLLEPGNIDLTNRPQVKNADGSVSTVRSITVEMDGATFVLPTVMDNGTIVSDRQAIDNFQKTGKHLGKFKTEADAIAYAQSLHGQQAGILGPQTVKFDPKDVVSVRVVGGAIPTPSGAGQPGSNSQPGLPLTVVPPYQTNPTPAYVAPLPSTPVTPSGRGQPTTTTMAVTNNSNFWGDITGMTAAEIQRLATQRKRLAGATGRGSRG